MRCVAIICYCRQFECVHFSKSVTIAWHSVKMVFALRLSLEWPLPCPNSWLTASACPLLAYFSHPSPIRLFISTQTYYGVLSVFACWTSTVVTSKVFVYFTLCLGGLRHSINGSNAEITRTEFVVGLQCILVYALWEYFSPSPSPCLLSSVNYLVWFAKINYVYL